MFTWKWRNDSAKFSYKIWVVSCCFWAPDPDQDREQNIGWKLSFREANIAGLHCEVLLNMIGGWGAVLWSWNPYQHFCWFQISMSLFCLPGIMILWSWSPQWMCGSCQIVAFTMCKGMQRLHITMHHILFLIRRCSLRIPRWVPTRFSGACVLRPAAEDFQNYANNPVLYLTIFDFWNPCDYSTYLAYLEIMSFQQISSKSMLRIMLQAALLLTPGVMGPSWLLTAPHLCPLRTTSHWKEMGIENIDQNNMKQYQHRRSGYKVQSSKNHPKLNLK